MRDEQTHPHRPRLVVSHSTCPPLSSFPHANSFVIGPAVIKHTHLFVIRYCRAPQQVLDLSITHDRIGSSGHVQQNGLLSHPQDHDAPLRLAVLREVSSYRQQYADNQNISFLPAIMTTSSCIHGEFLRLLFLQAHRETTAHFIATGLPSQQN